MDGFIILIVIIVIVYIWKRNKNQKKTAGVRNVKEKQACQNAIELANQYVKAFNNRESIARLNDLSEDVIELAVYYWTKYDIASYRCLLESAKEISYMYQGNKYPHDLVEDLIRERCK